MHATPFFNLKLAAVCDLDIANANAMADEAQQLIGSRPRAYARIADMEAGVAELTIHSRIAGPRDRLIDLLKARDPAAPLLTAARALGCRTQTGIGMVTAAVELMLDFFVFRDEGGDEPCA